MKKERREDRTSSSVLATQFACLSIIKMGSLREANSRTLFGTENEIGEILEVVWSGSWGSGGTYNCRHMPHGDAGSWCQRGQLQVTFFTKV